MAAVSDTSNRSQPQNAPGVYAQTTRANFNIYQRDHFRLLLLENCLYVKLRLYHFG